MTPADPAMIGGKYRILRRLGHGAMGSVYEALAPSGEHVAIKVIMTELAGNATYVGRFEREARTAASIDTPHICKTLDTGTDPESGLPFLVMELLHGEDIDQILKDLSPLPPALALKITAQACLALRDAHAARVIHRDIKPANLFLAKHTHDQSRIVKLLDFGVAKVRPDPTRGAAETAGLTRTGSMLGSPLYMSPEQARGYKDIDFRSDIFSLGVSLYKMLAGRAPHGETEELGELIILICTEQPPPIQDVAPWVPPEVAAIVHKTLRFHPNERWDSAADMYSAIMALLPDGAAIHESMLRPMSDAEKAVVAPRLAADLTDAPPPPRKSLPRSGPDSLSGSAPGSPAASGQVSVQATGPTAWSTGPAPSQSGALAVSQGGSGSFAEGVSGPSQSLPGAPISGPIQPVSNAPSRAPVLAVAGAIGALLLGGAGFAVYKATSPAAGAGSAPAQGAEIAQAPRTVTVVILPPDATVELDGQKATLFDGLLEITGPIGSVHKVKVTAGDAGKDQLVVVSDSGAVPPKIELVGARPAASATASSTKGAPAATKAPQTGPKSPPKAPEVLRNKR